MVTKSESEKLRLQNFRRRLFKVLCLLSFFILLAFGLSPWVKIGVNGTDSVDGYIFLIAKNVKPERDQLVAFWPKKNQFYQNIWFVKYVKGMPGDYIHVKDRSFYINGHFLGDAKIKSRSGIPMQATQPGQILRGQYFVWTPHKDSFDSRYAEIGLVSEDTVIGRAYRIF